MERILIKVVVLLLLAKVVLAADANVSLNNVPAFSSAVSDRYKDAASKAQEAFLIQSGIGPTFDMASGVLVQDATNEVGKTIDNNTPLKSKQVFFIGGVSYMALVRKQFVQKFKDPLFPKVDHVVTVDKNSSSLTVGFPF